MRSEWAGNTARPIAKDAIDESSKSEYTAVWNTVKTNNKVNINSPTKAFPIGTKIMRVFLLLRIQQSEDDSSKHCSQQLSNETNKTQPDGDNSKPNVTAR